MLQWQMWPYKRIKLCEVHAPGHEAQGSSQRILGTRKWAGVLAGLKSAFLLRVDVFRGEENVRDGGVLQMVQKYSDYNEEI